jgi:transcriptional regulator with XRE-family HTH domain
MIVVDWRAFGEQVMLARKRQRHSQAALAYDAGISRNYVSLIERGLADPGYAIVLTLCQALSIDPPKEKQ